VIVLATDRLLLRHMTEDDAAFVCELLNEPSFIQYIGDRGVRTLEDAREYIRTGPMESYAQHGFGLYTVVLKERGDAAGICGLLKRDALEDPDVGFAFLPRYWSQGYAFEAAAAVLEHGRHTHDMTRILAITSPDNVASITLLAKLGFHFERMDQLADDSPLVRVFALDDPLA